MKTKKNSIRSGVAVAMNLHYRGKGGTMKDRRAARKGARNKQRDYQEGRY